jgi:7-carboxy-7-deazaguanine synthase
MTLKVNDVYASIQGEGCQAGVPMVLIRLQGCGVGCPWCDTKQTWTVEAANRRDALGAILGDSPLWCEVGPDALAAYCRDNFPGPKWALVTGGEPADQDLGPLVEALHRRGYKVALETSGTAVGHVGAGFDWVCVSPKVAMPGGRPVLRDAVMGADEIKHVVGRDRDIEALDRLLAILGPDLKAHKLLALR